MRKHTVFGADMLAGGKSEILKMLTKSPAAIMKNGTVRVTLKNYPEKTFRWKAEYAP